MELGNFCGQKFHCMDHKFSQSICLRYPQVDILHYDTYAQGYVNLFNDGENLQKKGRRRIVLHELG